VGDLERTGDLMTTTVVSAEYLAGPNGPEWFTQMCAAEGLSGDARVVAVTARPVGTGQVGESVRFRLTWEGEIPADCPQSVIGKFPSQDPQTRATAKMVETYEREFGFYSSLQARVGIQTPHAHHIAIDAPTGDFTLIMEDIADAVQGDQLGGCTREDALLIAEAAAGLHAPSWDVATTLGDLEWLVYPDIASARDRTALYQAVLPGFCDRYGDRIGPDAVAAAQWLSARLEGVMQALLDLSELDLCVTHNDFRLDNMLFATGPAAPRLTTVDWQTVSAGLGPIDMAYALGSGMLPELRERHEGEIFSAYVGHLGSVSGSKMGPITESKKSQLWDAYRLGSTSGLAMAVTASMIVVRTDRGDEMFSVMAERHAAQMATLDVFSMLP
jgi:hypothetical protein